MPYTTSPLSVAVTREVPPEFIRLPKPGQKDPIFGLSRTALNEFILPTKANKHTPPVRSLILRKRGAKTGVRLIDLASLRAYLNMHQEPSFKPAVGDRAPTAR